MSGDPPQHPFASSFHGPFFTSQSSYEEKKSSCAKYGTQIVHMSRLERNQNLPTAPWVDKRGGGLETRLATKLMVMMPCSVFLLVSFFFFHD